METLKLLHLRQTAGARRWAALACVAAALAGAPTAPSAAERPDTRVVAAAADASPAKAAPVTAPAQGGALRALDDEAAASAVPGGEAAPNYGTLGLALLALVLWVGLRLQRRD